MATGYLAYRTAARRVSDVLAVLVAMASAIPAADHAEPAPRQRGGHHRGLGRAAAAGPAEAGPCRSSGPCSPCPWPPRIWDDFQAVNALALLIALYTVAALRPLREALACAGVLFVVIVAAAVSVAGGERWYDGIFICGLFGGALGLGLYSATRRDYLAGLTDRAERLERERDQQVALAAAAERARIAREMHDIVAHNLTVMVTLSEAAATSVPTSPARSAELMRSVSVIGRRALTDTRSLLGAPRQGPAPASPEVLPAPRARPARRAGRPGAGGRAGHVGRDQRSDPRPSRGPAAHRVPAGSGGADQHAQARRRRRPARSFACGSCPVRCASRSTMTARAGTAPSARAQAHPALAAVCWE